VLFNSLDLLCTAISLASSVHWIPLMSLSICSACLLIVPALEGVRECEVVELG